ncbi:hypothetical protein ACHOLT_09465 [Desulfitobacterium sp. Sab5]|uniref:hypothetical protein n=1 Tax=Desulfitobacterium nosdiversum TaxID=3375356 RepID=UPI003CFA0CFA
MDKESNNIERDVDMAIAKDPKNGIQQNIANEHKRKISKALKEVTSQHSKLLKKLAE